MKKFYFFFIAACLTHAAYTQVLFTYGNTPVTKEEFLRAYNKNKTAVTDKEMAMREYLDLYIKFKLKVKAAKDMRIDTLPSLSNDLQNFRTQIEESYLNDEGNVNALVQEAFNRSQKDIHAAFLFFPSKDFKDSIAVEQYHRIAKSEWTDIGFITVFTLPYELENIIYALKPGEESRPYRGRTGYYIFKNIEERKPAGKIKVAQIMIAIPEGAKEEDKHNAKRTADSVYKALLAGADFGEAAKQVSNDQMSYMQGGQVPEFGVGKYDPEFENKVFAISKDGEIAPPFLTKFGYHIVKRLTVSPVPSTLTNDHSYQVKQLVMDDKRIEIAKDKFVGDILKRFNYKKNTAIKQNDLWRMTDSAVAGRKIAISGLTPASMLFSLNNKSIKVSEWISFVKNYKASLTGSAETNEELMKKFTAKTALEIFKKRLPDFNPEFKYQLQEFREGNMLFEVMERRVWNKASGDSTGLKNYYQQNKSKYTWGESAEAILVSCSDEKTAKEAIGQIKKGKSWRQVTEENSAKVQADSGRYELIQIPALPGTKFSQHLITTPVVNENDGTATFAYILQLYPSRQQRSFEEARGLVINDYQVFLEDRWIEQLKQKYPVKINENVFKSVL